MRIGIRALAWLVAPALLGCLACGQGETAAPPAEEKPAAAAPATPSAPPAGAASARAEAEEIFATRCQTCHGPEGAGDGPGSAALDPKPRNFQDTDWQASVTDEHLANIIQYGGAAVGRSPAMPGNPDLTSRPEVVKALVSVIRDLGKG